MKKVLTVSVALNAAFVAAALRWNGFAAHAAGGGGAPVGNGDVNGDGELDISDAVYLLSSLFTGGPGPRAIECPAQSAKGLPATGHTKCYDQGGVEIACDGATCPGQDGLYRSGCPSEGRFVDNGDGTVTDNCTGLMWQKDSADVSRDGRIDDNDRLPWCDALAYGESLSFAGHDDWRLPNVRELQSIVDYGRFGPAVDPIFGAMSDGYWSSTSFASNPNLAWGVYFTFGHSSDGVVFVVFMGQVSRFYVRAVRTGP